MFKIVVALKDIIVDPLRPVDLMAMSIENATSEIRRIYEFLPKSADVAIINGSAVITIDDCGANPSEGDKKRFKKAISEAKKGNYLHSIDLLEKFLKSYPTDIDARRNLAMAYLESGKNAEAKDHLEKCLRLNPQDPWTLALLGNFYAKIHRNFDVAAFYYEAGLAQSPTDSTLLNNYAALQMDKGNDSNAQTLFEKAIESNATHPSAYYGLACLLKKQNQLQQSLSIVEKLFQNKMSPDVRTFNTYQASRALYHENMKVLACRKAEETIDFVLEEIKRFEMLSGERIVVTEDNSLGYISAVAQMGWKHAREEHVIRYRQSDRAILPHLLAHELEHIILEYQARTAGKNHFFASTIATMDRAKIDISKQMLKFKKKIINESDRDQLIEQLIHGLCGQIYNCPLDMIVEYRIFTKHPVLRASQFVSLYKIYQEGLESFKNSAAKAFVPQTIVRSSNTLNGAYSLFIDFLYKGCTDYSSAYRGSGFFSTSEKLFNEWSNVIDNMQPGKEYFLVDKFAAILNLQKWFTWIPDETQKQVCTLRTEGQHSIPLDDKGDVYNFCLDALRRFDGKSREEILKIITEISMIGMTGIDRASKENKYHLKTLPGEEFYGLQLLCFLYVGFRIYDDSIDCGLDFSSEYNNALEAFKAVKH